MTYVYLLMLYTSQNGQWFAWAAAPTTYSSMKVCMEERQKALSWRMKSSTGTMSWPAVEDADCLPATIDQYIGKNAWDKEQP